MNIRKIVIAVTGMLVACGANATIISGMVTGGVGTFVELNIPFIASNPNNTVGADTFQSPNLFAFNEGQNIVLTNSLAVDDIGGGIAGSLAAGTIVAAHYVFFDPRGSSSQQGWVSFDSPILGILTSSALLGGSDFLLNNGVTYQNPGLRGLEPGDSATFSANTVNVSWVASSPGDYIRVLTQFSPGANVPEPATLLLFAAGLFGFGLARSRKA